MKDGQHKSFVSCRLGVDTVVGPAVINTILRCTLAGQSFCDVNTFLIPSMMSIIH